MTICGFELRSSIQDPDCDNNEDEDGEDCESSLLFIESVRCRASEKLLDVFLFTQERGVDSHLRGQIHFYPQGDLEDLSKAKDCGHFNKPIVPSNTFPSLTL